MSRCMYRYRLSTLSRAQGVLRRNFRLELTLGSWVHLGCWAHARRYFNDALQALPKDRRGPDSLSARFMDLIGKLYRVEALAKERGDGVEDLHRVRQRDSVPVLAEIEALLLANLHGVLPGSLLGKALHYLSAQWSKLSRFVDSGTTRSTTIRLKTPSVHS